YSRGPSEDKMDIYRVKMPIMRSPEPWVIVKGKVVDQSTGKPLGAKIVYERLPDGLELGVAEADPNTGEYEFRLPGGKKYGIRAEAADKISESQNLDLTNIQNDQTLDGKNFQLAPIQVATVAENVTITLNNIFFDIDKATLQPESYPELNRIASLLKERQTMRIEIAGHTDSTGPDRYNLQLSERRAKAVVTYLVRQGINSNRISVVFFGESKPIAPNTTEEG